ncbi:hypothetical protein QSV34_02165 [Porticoccus sp. W117]|uniref:hypothetical protein n=1 Tax=Porticoccus sp. W117 TaxID=3054777 RepID=UPI002596845F|nr:hypothetical protein [Porticoccus sp. W117]MDM3870154.1 hypothetical protein [Porticoccus sp. W117]
MKLITLIIISLLFTQFSQGNDMWPFGKKKISVEEQLSKIQECGIHMNSDSTLEDLFIWEDRSAIESAPYKPIIEALASEIEREPYSPISNNLWMCDYERIEDHGAYIEIIERLELMTNGALDLTNISDYVDVEEGTAWVQFEFRGKQIKWEATVDNDWLDPYIIVKYDELLKSLGADIRIYSNHTDYGQVAFFAAFSSAEFQCYKKLSPIKLELIENQT